jgi:hypothetical protein
MRAALKLVVSVLCLSAPVLAHAGTDSRQSSLAAATKRAMTVAPWVDVTVRDVTVGEHITWVAHTSGRQLYSCAARASGELVSGDQVACVRVALSRAQRQEMDARYDRTLRANYNKIPFPGQAITTYDYVPLAVR